jgi:hypothetical protein
MEAKQSRKHEDDGVSLPEDTIFDVLVRLRAKALCRFRCVSKAWRAVISDLAFVAAQRSHAGHPIVAMFESWLHPHYGLRVLDMHGNVLRVLRPCRAHRWRPRASTSSASAARSGGRARGCGHHPQSCA